MQIIRLDAYKPFLGRKAIWKLAQQAVVVQRLENRWENKAHKVLKDQTDYLLDFLEKYNRLPGERDMLKNLELLLVEHMLEIMDMGFEVAEDAVDDLDERAPTKRLGKKPPKVKIPRNLDDLKKFWDKVRREETKRNAKKITADDDIIKRPQSIFERTRTAYIKKVQSVWEKSSEAWRNGETGSKEAIREAFEKASGATERRISTIIETETTYYYNKTREAYYSQSDVVSHYLFLAVRDHATTKWCRTRHGKVFEKGTALFRDNVPPCHWNCRSEIVPLTRFNPRHRLLIEDQSKRATRSNIEPLPPGWGSRTA